MVRKFKGTGTLSFPGAKELNGSFSLVFQDRGKIKLFFTTSTNDLKDVMDITKATQYGKFFGESINSDYSITIEKVYFGRLKIPEKEFEFDILHTVTIEYQTPKDDEIIILVSGLSNFLFNGTDITQRGDVFSRDVIKLSLENKRSRLIQLQNYKEIERDLKENGGVRVTSEFKVEGLYKDISSLQNFTNNIQYLLSIASGNYVTVMYEDILKKGNLCSTRLFPLKTYPFSNRGNLIDTSLHGSEELKKFIELVYPKYVQYKRPLGLPYVLELFVTSKIYSPMEVQYLLTTTTLECLERYYRTWKNLKAFNSLRKKTKRILNDFKVPHKDNELGFNKIRNKIVHEGRFPPHVDKYESLSKLRNLLDRLLLGIFEYYGKPYFNILTGKKDVV